MTSTTHEGDVLAGTRPQRAALAPAARRWGLASRLLSRPTLARGLAPLAALGVLGLLVEGHGVAWLAGLLAGAGMTAWLIGLRTPARARLRPATDHGDEDTRQQLSLLENAGWSAVHDLDARYARYRHVAVGPGGVILVHSQRLEHRGGTDDPHVQRELFIQRRRALSAAANLRREIEDGGGASTWVQAVVVVWSDFPAGCVQDGRCAFVSGPRLVDWLRRRPEQLSRQRAAEVEAVLERLAGVPELAAAAVAG